MARQEADKPRFSPKTRLFIAEYPKDHNATQAAIRAGYSAKSAYAQGPRLLENVEIQRAIEADISQRLKRIGINKDRVLTEISRLSFADLRKIHNEDGTLKLPHEWDDEIAPAIAGIEIFEEFSGRGEDRKLIGYTRKVKVFDKPRSLEMLAKHLKLISDKVELTGKDGGPVELKVIFDKKKGNGADGE